MSLCRKWSAALPIAFLLVGLAGEAQARGRRVDQLPNGSALGCAACHVDPTGGGSRNAFGQMIEADFLTAGSFLGDVIWGPELAGLDADGDGATNGEELGDPAGAWPTDGTPGDPAAVTNPGDPDSRPPEPTAVEASTWASVKALFR
jgi:hypothetical protein